MADLIREATEDDACAIAGNLRRADRLEGLRLGAPPEALVMSSWRRAVIRRVGLWNGEIACMWGVCGEILSGKGVPWLVTTKILERAPVSVFLRHYRNETRDMLRLFQFLENHVDVRYTSAVRMLRLAGFQVDEPQPIGRRGSLLARFWMRAL